MNVLPCECDTVQASVYNEQRVKKAAEKTQQRVTSTCFLSLTSIDMVNTSYGEEGKVK